MTGTADTEAEELHKIYKLDVVAIPTNRGIQRKDDDDLVYKTEREKFKAVVEEISDSTSAGSPCSWARLVEKSEAIASLLRKRGIRTRCSTPSSTSARRSSSRRRAARARSPWRPTWPAAAPTSSSAATPRCSPSGDDPRPQGPDLEADAAELDALHRAATRRQCEKEREEVVGRRPPHHRHRAPRVAPHRQPAPRPRGPPGRPGSSRFYLSLEDDLMRIFAGERVQSIMDRSGWRRTSPSSTRWVTRAVENAQRRSRRATSTSASTCSSTTT
jgi:preprotein translocase subunit SecA